jgi:hypothetical protein
MMNKYKNVKVLTAVNFHIDGCGRPPELVTGGPVYTGYFENEEAEQLVFQYDYRTRQGKLWHGDYSWEHPVSVENGYCPSVVLSLAEQLWLQIVWKVATAGCQNRGKS